MKHLIAILCGLGLASAAKADDVVVHADWIRVPTSAQMRGVWPADALLAGKSGHSVIQCLISTQGALFDCKVISEDPVGSGFGAAAVALTPQFLARPSTRNGVPFVSTIRIPIAFTWPKGVRAPVAVATQTVLTNVVWQSAPTYAQVVAAYPVKARAAGIGGNAVLDCTLKEDGRLTACSVLGQTPKNMGFGDAAKSIMPLFLGPTTLRNGTSTKGAGVQIPVTFAVEMLKAEQPVVGKARWIALPSADNVADATPPQAVAAGITTGRATISCTIVQGGGLSDCAVVSEDPNGMGFGAATLGLTKGMRLSIWTAEGLPTIGAVVKAPIRFDIPAPEPAAPPKP